MNGFTVKVIFKSDDGLNRFTKSPPIIEDCITKDTAIKTYNNYLNTLSSQIDEIVLIDNTNGLKLRKFKNNSNN